MIRWPRKPDPGLTVLQVFGAEHDSTDSAIARKPKYEVDNWTYPLQVPDDQAGKYNLVLGKVVETKPAAVQGWSHGRNGSLDPTHSVQVLMEILKVVILHKIISSDGGPAFGRLSGNP